MGRSAGAEACLAQRFQDGAEPRLWLSPRLLELAVVPAPSRMLLEDPSVRALLERRISVEQVEAGPLAFARERVAFVAGLGFAARAGIPAGILWLGFASAPDPDRLEGLWSLLEQAAEAEHRYRRFFDHLPAVLIAVGIDGVIHECNDRVRQLGYEPEELIGQSGAPFFLPGERERVRRALAAGPITRQEVALRHHSGEVIQADLMVGLIRDDAGQPVEILVAGRDLRESRRLDHDRRMEAVGRLISGVAHELNNPLLTVLGNAEMLAEAKLSGSARRRAERVLSGARRCQDVVDELLRLRLRPKDLDQEVDIEAVLQRALGSVRGELESGPQGPQVDVRIPPSVKAVKGDARDLEQALANILRNAFQAVAGRTDGRIGVSVLPTERSLLVVVQDNGPGMDPEALERAFEPFYTTREVGKGRGLGLPIALGIVHDHGGHLELRSEQPGIRVQMTLPLPR